MSTSPKEPALERRREANGALWVALALSLAVHFPLLLAVPGAFSSDEDLERTEFNSAEEFSVSFREQQVKQDQDKQDEQTRGQFISAPPPDTEERPDEARFRDQYESKTDKEMVRRTPSSTPNAPESPAPDQGGRARRTSNKTPTTSPSIEQRERTEKQLRRAEDRSVEVENRREDVEQTTEEPNRDGEGESSESEETATAEQGLLEAAEDQDDAQKKTIDPSELFPSYADASGLSGGGGSVDYMRDVPEGDKNLLNRKRSRYWSFMDRIKRQVVQQWSPVAEYRKRDPTGDVYGVKDKVSILGVTLNGDGSVRKIYVAHPSGLDFYDDEAVRALRAAAPFPNPPEGLKDRDGLIHFNFMFVLSIDSGGGPLLRIRRR